MAIFVSNDLSSLTNLIQTLNYIFQTGDPPETVTYSTSKVAIPLFTSKYPLFDYFSIHQLPTLENTYIHARARLKTKTNIYQE